VNDSIYKTPVGTDRIDTIRFDSTNTIKFIEYISNDKVLKRLYYDKDNNVINGADYFDGIGRTIWEITWYSNGKVRSLWYHNMEVGQTWYEDGIIDESRTCINDTVLSTYFYKSGKTRKVVKTLSGYDSTNYYYSVTYCENGLKTSEDFSGKKYVYKSYYCNGNKEIICKKSSRDYFVGEFKKWNENGMLILKGQFVTDENNTKYLTMQDGRGFGQKEGKWKYYDDNGKLIKTEIYKNGILVCTKDSQGGKTNCK
jgi:antitoxin component YwqK of YwqJK toxin-antitoxin module